MNRVILKREMNSRTDAYAVLCRGEETDQVHDGYFTSLAKAKRVAKLRVTEGQHEVQVWKYVWSPKAARRAARNKV